MPQRTLDIRSKQAGIEEALLCIEEHRHGILEVNLVAWYHCLVMKADQSIPNSGHKVSNLSYTYCGAPRPAPRPAPPPPPPPMKFLALQYVSMYNLHNIKH
jgi:hypothetical protein